MGLSLGGGFQNNSGSQSGSYTGTQDSTQTGSQTNTTTGNSTTNTSGVSSGTTSGTTSGNTSVNTTGGYDSISSMLQGMLANGGMTPQQLASIGLISDSAQNTANAMDYGGKVLSQYVGDNHSAHQIASADKVDAPTGAAFMDQYINPFESAVVDATRNDLTQGFRTGLNELRASYGGAMGNGREGVAAGTAADAFDRTLATTLGGLRIANYGKAIDAGQADAGRQLSANSTNVSNKIGVDQFNTNQENVNDAQSIGVINDWIGQQAAKNGIVSGAAGNAAAASQSGIGNLLSYLQSQVPAFGQSSTGTTDGTTSGSTSGSSVTDSISKSITDTLSKLVSNTSGTSSGTSSSSGSGMQAKIGGK